MNPRKFTDFQVAKLKWLLNSCMSRPVVTEWHHQRTATENSAPAARTREPQSPGLSQDDMTRRTTNPARVSEHVW